MLPIPPPGWGAVEKAIFRLSEALRSRGVETEILNRPGKGRSLDEYRFAWKLRGLLRSHTWDILHASTPVVANRLRQMSLPYVYTSHSRHWSGTSGPSQRFGFYLERRAVAGALQDVALTPAIAELMRAGPLREHPERCRVIPNGVETSTYGPQWSERTGQVALGVGAVHPRKRWHVAVEAMSQLPQGELVIAGPIQDARYAEELRRRSPNGRLRLAGEVSETDLRALYSKADVFLLPSRSELMSMAVVEAMASGLPVIGTGRLEGMVLPGEQGYLIPEGSGTEEVTEIARRLGEILGDAALRRRMGESARAKAVTEWDWSVIAGKTLELYQGIPASTRSR